MAIVQISQITNRIGLQQDLPQLAGAELGWSTDTRQLYIGNGTLDEGAPVVGNTEILTEFSDILNLAASYTYKGLAAGYQVQTGPTPGSPVVLSLQSWMDQFCSVKDFGAMGDGLTDDTAAINRALNQLYCQQLNPSARRSLFFPAGVYVVSGTINIPTFAMLYGEGADCSIIRLNNNNGAVPYVAQTADSLQQTGINIGNNGAVPPTSINISNMSFQTLDPRSSAFLVSSTTFSEFHNVAFTGPGTTSTLTNNVSGTAGMNIMSSASIVTTNLIISGCRFSGFVYGVGTNSETKGITVADCILNTLYQGVSLGYGSVVNGGPTGFRIVNNTFNTIYKEGIFMGAVHLNFTGSNIFYDVADHFNGLSNPTGPVIQFQESNNVSVGDMFARSDAFAEVYPRIDINFKSCITFSNGQQIQMGTKRIESGLQANLISGSTIQPLLTLNVETVPSYKIDYSVIVGNLYRTGTLQIVAAGAGVANISDSGIENGTTALAFSVSQTGSNLTLQYLLPGSTNGQIKYSIYYFV